MEDTAFAAENRRYWDQMAETYNSKPWQVKLQKQIADELRGYTDFIKIPRGENVRLLDYACGPGSVSMTLSPLVTKITGIDLAQGMVDRFNAVFSSSTDPSSLSKGHAFVGDLTTLTPSEIFEGPEFYDFDVAAVALGFHHFAAPGLALQRLVERVKKRTGVVFIVDWLPDAGDNHHNHRYHHSHAHDEEALKTIRTHGFNEDDMRAMFEAAGCKDFAFRVMVEEVELFIGKEERRSVKTVFIARGTRASSL